MTQRDQRAYAIITATLIGVLLVAVSWRTPVPPAGYDPAMYQDTLHRFRSGQPYFAAMDAALKDSGSGPVSQARALRSPWLFSAWKLLGSDHAVWIAYLALVAGALVAAGTVLSHPFALLASAIVFVGLGLGGFMGIEVWAAPWIILSAVFAIHGRNKSAAAAATVAVLSRELAIPMIIGGLLWARSQSRPTWPWLSALAVSIASFAVHIYLSYPFLVPNGQGLEVKLLWSAVPSSWPRLMGFGMPFPMALGPLTWAMACVYAWRRGWILLMGPILSFVLIGLLVDRPYWGATITPLTALLAADLALSRSSRAFMHRVQGTSHRHVTAA